MAIPQFALADDDPGFAMSTDLTVGYSKERVSAVLGYDLGYRFNSWLYVGAGPMVASSFGDGSTIFNAGGYGKIRFTLPLEFTVKPYLDLKGGYSYNFDSKNGDALFGGGVGVKVNKFVIGFYANMSTYEKPTVNKKGKVGSKTELNFTPCLQLGLEF